MRCETSSWPTQFRKKISDIEGRVILIGEKREGSMDRRNEKEPSIFMSEDMVDNGYEDKRREEFILFEKGEKVTDLDLQLAAEIGKALLERNRELELLARGAQECNEEQTLRAQFYERQTEFLKESLESQTKVSEHLEAQNLELNDKCLQLQADNKTLNNRNKRFWETIESLEKKCENYRFEIKSLEDEKMQLLKEGRDCEEEGKKEKTNENPNNELDLSSYSIELEFEEKIESLQETIKELHIQQNIDNIEREELKAELEDISTDNQLLQHQVCMLENEIEEWKNVCEKAQKYKQLADKYSSQFDVFAPNDGLGKSQFARLKSCSHEVLNNAPLCGATELLATKQKYLSSSVSQLNQPPRNLSVLSEMDIQYNDLVRRYENLLDKYHGDDNSPNVQKRSQKVQRAIQTLSWDFSNFDLLTSPKKEKKTFTETQCALCDEQECENELNIDFRKMFVEIFAKLRESKEFDPSKKLE